MESQNGSPITGRKKGLRDIVYYNQKEITPTNQTKTRQNNQRQTRKKKLAEKKTKSKLYSLRTTIDMQNRVV